MSKQFSLHRFGGTDNFARVHTGLEVGVQIFIWVQSRAVAGQVEQLYALSVLFYPLGHLPGMVHAQVVDDQEHFALRLFAQPFEKLNKPVRIQAFPVEHETQLALIGQGRNQLDSASPGLREHQHWPLAAWRVTARVMFNRTDCRLIGPTYFGSFGLGTLLNGRVVLFEPKLYRLRALLVGALDRALRRKTPMRQILAHRAGRHINQKQLFDQRAHRLGIPECKFQLELIRTVINQFALDDGFLGRIQTATAARGATALVLDKRRFCTLSVAFRPSV